MAEQKLFSLKEDLEKCNASRKQIREIHDPLEREAVAAMMSAGRRYVETMNQTGVPEFYTLSKKKDAGTFSKERQTEFFALLLNSFQQGTVRNPDACCAAFEQYMKQHGKRKLVIEKVTKRPPKHMEDLVTFLQGVAE